MTATTLPSPTRERWQPLRLGLVDLYYYDDEEFRFRDGRLLLRGNNGTGKSKVLALTLPFLLDGSLAARRVEPDGDPAKRMEWNLLLGGAHPHPERIGYTWLEFGRLAEDGTEHFVTLGCGLKAAAGRGIAKHWFFTSTRRIGDLRLVDETGIAITGERLADEFETRGGGRVHTTRESYRHAVDEALFQLGERRYAALVDLLIQLRQPQLSKRPDEQALSDTLTEALTPLDQAVIADVAEAFRSLDEERNSLADERAALEAAEAFLRDYVHYARVAAERAAADVRRHTSTYERIGRDQIDLTARLKQHETRLAEIAATAREASEEQRSLQGRERALRASPEMRSAAELEHAGGRARDAERVVEQAAGVAAAAQGRAEAAANRADQLAGRAAEMRDVAERAEGAARSAAAAAALGVDHESLLADAARAERELRRRLEQLSHVEELLAAAQHAAQVAERERQVAEAARTAADSRADALAEAEQAVEAAAGAYLAALRRYLGDLQQLQVPEPDALLEAAADWTRTLSDEVPPARAAVEASTVEALGRIAAARAELVRERAEVEAALSQARSRLAELECGGTPLPPIAPTRDPAVRHGQPGAPLWQLVDFADHVDQATRAGLEAALEGAGLLDGWVRPDGTVTDVATGDLVLGEGADAASAAAATPTLVDVLVPAIGDHDVPDAVIAAVLRRIGWGEGNGEVWVAGDGRYAVGPARGRWHSDRARYLGAGAREAARREAIERVTSEIAELEARIDQLEASQRVLEEDAGRVRAERAAHPVAEESAVVRTHHASAAAHAELMAATERADAARAAFESADAIAAEASRALADTATQLRAPQTSEGLAEAREAARGYRAALDLVRRERAALAAAEADAAAVAAERDQSEAEAHERLAALTAAREEHARRVAYADELRATVGAAVDALEAELARVQQRLEGVATRLDGLRSEELEAERARGQATGELKRLEEERAQAGEVRAQSVAALQAFAATGLLRVALPDLADVPPDGEGPWQTTAGVALARAISRELASLDAEDRAWADAQQRITDATGELQAQMSRRGHTAYQEQHGSVVVVRVSYRGDDIDVDLLAAKLAADLQLREQVLSAREREILENHLVTDVAGHLSDLLARAAQQIADMNAELEQRKTSTGMQLRVRWQPRADAPEDLGVALRLLMRSDAAWSQDDRAAIGDFLSERIRQVRADDPSAGWTEQLERALDYRAWHSFVVELRQGGQWRSASGPASGGERVLAVYVPLFAAASSHYHSAGARAPRLILLDEAFAGVDDDARAKTMGLLTTFDLDVVMTSEREWACYPEVPGIAIAQLTRVEGVDAVGVSWWRWDGRRRTPDPEAGATGAAGLVREASDELESEGLFA